MFLTGKPSYPVERTLLTTGLIVLETESLYQQQQRQETPHLCISYQPSSESTFWRSTRFSSSPGRSFELRKTTNTDAEGECEPATAPKRLAVITTIYRYLSHAQHFADRFLVGYPIRINLRPFRVYTTVPPP